MDFHNVQINVTCYLKYALRCSLSLVCNLAEIFHIKNTSVFAMYVCVCLYICICVYRYIYDMLYIVGWPKSSFWLFCNILWKNPNELFGHPCVGVGVCVCIHTYIYAVIRR